MALGEKLWDALAAIIRMNDKIVGVAVQMQAQQSRIEDLTARVIRLETALELALASQGRRGLAKPK